MTYSQNTPGGCCSNPPLPPRPTAVSNSVPLFETILSAYETTPSSKFDATLVLKGTYVLILPSESHIISSRSFTLLMNAFWTSLACLVALWFFFAQLPFGFCSSSATDFWSGLPPTFPAYLPTIPSKLCALVSNKYFWPAAAQLSSQSLHLGLLSVRPLWRSRRSRRREALYARVQSRGAISSRGGGSIKQLQYMHKGARPASSATSLSLPFIAH